MERNVLIPNFDTIIKDHAGYEINATYIEFHNQGTHMVEVNGRRIMPMEYYKYDTHPVYVWNIRPTINFHETDLYGNVRDEQIPINISRGKRLLVQWAFTN
jgi:hypothetical protein